MPKQKDGSYILSESLNIDALNNSIFTDKQLNDIMSLIDAGKNKEAQALIDEILKAEQ